MSPSVAVRSFAVAWACGLLPGLVPAADLSLNEEQERDLALVLAAVASHQEALDTGRAEFVTKRGDVDQVRGTAWWKGGETLTTFEHFQKLYRRGEDGRRVLSGTEWEGPATAWETPEKRVTYLPGQARAVDNRRQHKIYQPELKVAPADLWFRLEGPGYYETGLDWQNVLDPAKPFGAVTTTAFDVRREGGEVTISRAFDDGYAVTATASREAGWNVVRYRSAYKNDASGSWTGTFEWAKHPSGVWWAKRVSTVYGRAAEAGGEPSEPITMLYENFAPTLDGVEGGQWPPPVATLDLPEGTVVTRIGPGDGPDVRTRLGGRAAGEGAPKEETLRALGEGLKSSGFGDATPDD